MIVGGLLVAWGCDAIALETPGVDRVSAALAPQPPAADWTVSGEATNTGLGLGLTAADINGDGFSEVITGSTFGPRLYLGGSSGLGPTPAWPTGSISHYYSSARAGDVNGDGFDDLI